MWNLLADSKKLIPPHAGKVMALQLSPDGSSAASIAADGAKVWALGSPAGGGALGQCLATLQVRIAASALLLSI